MSSWFGKAPVKWDPTQLDLGPVSELKDDAAIQWDDFDDEGFVGRAQDWGLRNRFTGSRPGDVLGEGVGEVEEGVGEGLFEVGLGEEGVGSVGASVLGGLVGTFMSTLGAIGFLVSMGFLISDLWTARMREEKDAANARALSVAFNSRNEEYDGRLRVSAAKANVRIPPLPSAVMSTHKVPVTGWFGVEFPEQGVSVPWSYSELLGGIVLEYLDMRANHPEMVYSPSKTDPGTLYYENELYAIMQIAWSLHPEFPYVVDLDHTYSVHWYLFNTSPRTYLSAFLEQYQYASQVVSDNPMSASNFSYHYGEYTKWLDKNNRSKVVSNLKDWLMRTHKVHNVGDMQAADWMSSRMDRLRDLMSGGGTYYRMIYEGVEGLNYLVVYVQEAVMYLKGQSGQRYSAGGLAEVLAAAAGLRSALISVMGNTGGEKWDWTSRLSDFVGKYDYNLLHKGFAWVLSSPLVMLSYLSRGVDLGHFQTYLSLGIHDIMNGDVTTVDDYNSKKNLINIQLETDLYDMRSYYGSGGKPKGDNETIEEFNARFDAWRRSQAGKDVIEINRHHVTLPPVDTKKPFGPGLEIDGDGNVKEIDEDFDPKQPPVPGGPTPPLVPIGPVDPVGPTHQPVPVDPNVLPGVNPVGQGGVYVGKDGKNMCQRKRQKVVYQPHPVPQQDDHDTDYYYGSGGDA